jgi:hypothetical protein
MSDGPHATARRTWWRLAGALAAGAASLALVGGSTPTAADSSAGTAGATGARSVARASDDLAVIDQTFTVAVDASFDVVLGLPAGVDVTDFDERSVLVVTSHRAIADRFQFQQSTKGELTRTEDSFDIGLDPVAADPNLLAAADGTITVRIPTESLTRTPEALQMSQSGVHPVLLELRLDDRPKGEVITYVNRLPSVPSGAPPLSVAFVTRQLSLPSIGVDGTVTVSDTADAELTDLAATLAALDAAGVAAAVPVPRGVQVEPSVLQAVIADDPELAATLVPGLTGSELIAAPRLPLDPSAAAAAGEDARYGDWLRQGEDALGGALATTTIDRSVVLVDERLSSQGAAMQRNLGARMLVLPYDFYSDLDGSLLDFTDISQLVTVELDDGQTVPAAIVDDFLGSQMVRGADEPVLTAIEVAAELVVLARDIDIDGGAVDKHGVILALPDLGIPDATFVAELTPLLLSSPSLRLVSPRELGTNTTTLLNDGRLVMLTLPDSAGPDLSARIERLDDVTADVLAYASMLPEGAADIARWSATLEALPSTALTDAQAEAAIDRLGEDFAAYREAIVAPEPFAFTLTGRESTLRFSLANTSDQPLRVRVNLSSPKMRFPDGDQIVTVEAQSETDVGVDVEALSNGKSSVFLRIYAPAENREVQLVPEVVLTARVNSFAGLGQLITGAGLLLVITWWAHHARSSRRKTAAARYQSHHPTARREPSGASAAPVAPAGEVSPDAAASSLPPS